MTGSPATNRLHRAGAVNATLDEWERLRKELRAIEEAEHPPITDVLGRQWTWKDGDLYVHDGMAWPREFVERAEMELPSQAALENPNYRWCPICRGESPRRAARDTGADWKPEDETWRYVVVYGNHQARGGQEYRSDPDFYLGTALKLRETRLSEGWDYAYVLDLGEGAPPPSR